MLLDDKKQALFRALAGGMSGLVCWLLLSWLTQPGSLFGTAMSFDFTFYYGNLLSEALGGAISGVLWFCFGVEAGVATLPFADGGRCLVLRSLLHFAVMMLTVGLWAFLNFFNRDYPMAFWGGDLWYFLVPFTLVYALVWLGRWVGWYAEAEQIRESLGLTTGPSFLHWRETLPYLFYAGVLCLVLPFLLRMVDAHDVPVLCGILLPYLLLPVGGFFSALSLGKRQGFCPLYPLACGVFYLPAVFLLMNSSALFHCLMVAVPALAGNLAGAAVRRRRRAEKKANAPSS